MIDDDWDPGGEEMPPFEQFVDFAQHGELRPELLAGLKGLTAQQLETIIDLMSSDKALSSIYPYRLKLGSRTRGRLRRLRVDVMIEDQERYREVSARINRDHLSREKAIERVADERHMGTSDLNKIFNRGKKRSLLRKRNLSKK